MNKILIKHQVSQEQVFNELKKIRETKGQENEALRFISDALSLEHETMVNLFWEETLTYQHMYMNDASNKKALQKMKNTVLFAQMYIKKFRLNKWNSRLYRFLGRIEDYKGNYKSAVDYYKKAILYVKDDNEKFRKFELEGFLAVSLILSGKTRVGYDLSHTLYKKYISSKEGKALKNSDYQTWAIWISGLVIRTIDSLISKKVIVDILKLEKWLKEVEDYLKGDGFSYRKDQIKVLWTKIQNLKV